MRIAQLTFNVYNNYGNMLQKYALHRVLRRHGEADVIWHTKDEFLPETWEWTWRPQLAKMSRSSEERRKFTFEVIRQAKFKEFEQRHIRTRFDVRALEDIADEYDYFVVGSDQVWNPEFTEQFFPGRFLTFAPKEKRIAYAASIAVPSIPERFQAAWRKGILGMSRVSLRERSAVGLVKELTGLEPPALVDPVFLLTASEWSEVAIKPPWLDGRYESGYILTYFLGRGLTIDIQKISSEVGLPVIALFDPRGSFDHYNVGPAEFLWLAAHASLIYTNSFHGTAFSILFGRPFVMCNFLNAGFKQPVLSRNYALLEMCGLTERLAVADKNFMLARPLEIDYSARDEVMTRERSRALAFLDEALGGDGR